MRRENILVICRQNVGRSQIGEGYLRSMCPSLMIRSAGIDTKGMKKKYKNHPHPQVIASMREDGVDISNQKITQLRKRHMRAASRIICLCESYELPAYVGNFAEKVIMALVVDPAPQDTKVPLLDIDKLRIVREQIKSIMEGYVYGQEFAQAA